ncbi:MAG: hypothetical protein NZ529_03240 [Cytophagaceae bacterium]|nr:hypothetical protein [Cytophagaceae bacterium]MDW8455784.1 hypothetical protein [Cytophagaceae bacterium]
MNFVGFVFCAAIIFWAGRKLSHYGELMADLTGMGRAWIGLVLMSTVTSLPELMVGISSSAIVQSADLAVGDILGSCACNLAILSLMDVFTPKHKPLFSGLSQSHILAASFGIILLGMCGVGIFLTEEIMIVPSMAFTSVGFAVTYFISVHTMYKYQKKIHQDFSTHKASSHEGNLKPVLIKYFLFATVITGAALALPYFAEHIAEEAGISKSFAGTLFLAVSTSLPEISVSVAAVGTGSPDMAAGNLVGSNIFNIFILFIDDVVYTKGHLLKHSNDMHLLSVLFVMSMSAIVIIGLIYPSRPKKFAIAATPFIILLLYLTSIFLLYHLTS